MSRANIQPFILIGNHDKINEKSKEHSLNFLKLYARVVEQPYSLWRGQEIRLIPYYSDSDELRIYLKTIPKGSTLIMHQGLQSSNSGEYIQDKSAITKQDVSGFRVISGHYHTRQTIDLPDGGKWDYIGNPYSLNFAEANDPPKGFQILMDDGTLEFVPTNLRKHVVINIELRPYNGCGVEEFTLGTDYHGAVNPDDLIWVKVKGSKQYLSQITKKFLGPFVDFRENFKLDLIPTDNRTEVQVKDKSKPELLDSIIDSTSTSDDCKIRLKKTWRDLV